MKKTTYTRDTLVGDKTIAEWNLMWVDMPGGFAVPHPSLGRQAGLYRAMLHGETMVIGMGAGTNNRLASRLYDLRRDGDSGRRYRSGEYIYEHRNILDLQVLTTGDDLAACRLAGQLSRAMKGFHSPSLMVPDDIVRKVAFG